MVTTKAANKEIKNIYDGIWDKEEAAKEKDIKENIIDKLPRGKPREGLTTFCLRKK